MFETSSDILNLIIALSVLLFTVFLVWAIYYLIASLRKIFKIAKDVETGVQKVIDTADVVKKKVKQSSSYLYMAGEVAKRVVDIMGDKKPSAKASRKKNTK